jgi:hypothetical protein
MKQSLSLSVVVAALVAIVLGSGCAGLFGKPAQQEPVSATAAPVQFKDLPVPYGFEFVPQKSWSHVAPTFRAGVMTYRGDSPVWMIRSFYAREMPFSGWKLLEIHEPTRTAAVMRFLKGKETCIVSLRKSKDLTVLTLEIRE